MACVAEMTDAAIIERQMVTAAAAAEMLGLSKRQVYDYAAKGQLPCMGCAEMQILRAVWQNSSHTFA